jgi:nitrogen regulatory protein P-II 1
VPPTTSDRHNEEPKTIIRPNKVDAAKNAPATSNVSGMTVSEVCSHGKQKRHTAIYRGQEYGVSLLPRKEIEVVVPDYIVHKTSWGPVY